MNPIPWALIARIAAPVLLALAAWWWIDGRIDDARADGLAAGLAQGRADVQARWDDAKERQRKADAAEADRLRTELKGITDAAQAQAARDRAAVDRARAAGDELQRTFAAALARCRDPAVAEGSAPAAGTGDLLADVSRRIDSAAGELAAVAQERGRAGSACERSYDALTPQ